MTVLPKEQEFEAFLSELHEQEFEEENYSYENERTLLQEVMEEFEDENPAPVPFKNVPFAPLPPEGSYWPLISTHELAEVISYMAPSGLIGENRKRFGASRKSSGGRYHAAIDMYAKHKDSVIAVDHGTIIKHGAFNGKTYSLVVKHTTMVINYGEVEKELAPGLKVGSIVFPGQIIGYAGKNPRGESMLHFEVYTIAAKTNQKWHKGSKAPAQLYNPTLLLLYLKNFGKRATQEASVNKEDTTTAAPVINETRATKRNASFSEKIGWGTHLSLIQKRLETNATQGEEAFAHAVARWQKAQNYPAKKITGILDRVTWNLLKKSLDITNKMSAKRKGTGWVISGGRDIKWVLCELRRKGLLTISANEMEMFRLVSGAESNEKISAVNNWDNVFMSMGFTQFTIGVNTLQRVIRRVPAAYKKYGIELTEGEKYPGTDIDKIKGTTRPGDLRSYEWGEKFYKAGLDEEIIVALIQEARKRLNDLLAYSDPTDFLRTKFANHRFPNLWAHVYESNNAAPSPFKKALKEAITEAIKTRIENPVRLSEMITKKFAKKWHRARHIAKKMHADQITVLDDAAYCN
ncbi:MAG: M23 family metallopeptidase [Bacteroidia bacterium]